jgi:hypothetical protein
MTINPKAKYFDQRDDEMAVSTGAEWIRRYKGNNEALSHLVEIKISLDKNDPFYGLPVLPELKWDE